MNINKNAKLVLRDVYLYDIEACHYTILTKLGIDMPGIDKNNKLQRNTQIGKMMKKNPKLTSMLRSTTRSIIDEYILRNKITEDDIILRQYDGIIITKTLNETSFLNHVPLHVRKHYQIFISSIDRKKYISFDSKHQISIKGVPYRYPEIDKIFEQICRINFANKDSIFRNLQKIKDKFIASKNARLFGIPLKNGKVSIFLKGYGEIVISSQTLKIIDTDDIDKQRYFKHYIEPFTKSIVIEFVR